MKRLKKLALTLPIIFVCVFSIYSLFNNDKLIYIALGDSVAEGRNPYGEIGYGYTDFISDKLKEETKLKYYTKEYTKSGYKTQDILIQLDTNNKIKKDLRESDLVTISIGANDFLSYVDKNNLSVANIKNLKNIAKYVMPDIDNCIKEVRKYAKSQLIIVGYYNPIPFLFNTNMKDIEDLFNYVDSEYSKIAKKYNAIYISNYELFKSNSDYLPNPLDIHPNIEGYRAIANEVLKKINR